jgi:hypothetical protein
MALMVKEDVALDPMEAGFFGAIGVVFWLQFITDLFEEFLFEGLVSHGFGRRV